MNQIYYIGDSEHQGHLVIMRDLSTNILFIYDDAGLFEWQNPGEALEDTTPVNEVFPEHKFSKWNSDSKAEYATWDEIVSAGWDKYVSNRPQNV